MKLFCVPNIAVHALPFQVASMPGVRFDLNGGLLTCLYFIIYQGYNVICISINRMWTRYDTRIYFYPFMLNKLCLSLSHQVSENCAVFTGHFQQGYVWKNNILSVTHSFKVLGANIALVNLTSPAHNVSASGRNCVSMGVFIFTHLLDYRWLISPIDAAIWWVSMFYNCFSWEIFPRHRSKHVKAKKLKYGR